MDLWFTNSPTQQRHESLPGFGEQQQTVGLLLELQNPFRYHLPLAAWFQKSANSELAAGARHCTHMTTILASDFQQCNDGKEKLQLLPPGPQRPPAANKCKETISVNLQTCQTPESFVPMHLMNQPTKEKAPRLAWLGGSTHFHPITQFFTIQILTITLGSAQRHPTC